MRAKTTWEFQLPGSRPTQRRRIMLAGNRYTVSTLEVAGTVKGKSWETICESPEKAARAAERHIARFLREGYLELKPQTQVTTVPGGKRRARSPRAAPPVGGWPDRALSVNGDVWALTFVPDGSRLMILATPKTTFRARPAVIEVWRASGDAPERIIRLPPAPVIVKALAASPDSQHVISGYQVQRVVELESGKTIRSLKGHDGFWMPVNDVAVSRDGALMATAGDDMTARLWDSSTGRQIRSFKHSRKVAAVSFTPNGRRLVTACDGGQTPERFGALQSVALDGSRFIDYTLPGNVRPYGRRIALSPGGDMLVLVMEGNNGFGIWNARTGAFIKEITARRDGAGTDALFSPDGKRLILGHWKTITVWATKPLRRIRSLKGNGRLTMTADGRFMGYQDGRKVKVRALKVGDL